MPPLFSDSSPSSPQLYRLNSCHSPSRLSIKPPEVENRKWFSQSFKFVLGLKSMFYQHDFFMQRLTLLWARFRCFVYMVPCDNRTLLQFRFLAEMKPNSILSLSLANRYRLRASIRGWKGKIPIHDIRYGTPYSRTPIHYLYVDRTDGFLMSEFKMVRLGTRVIFIITQSNEFSFYANTLDDSDGGPLWLETYKVSGEQTIHTKPTKVAHLISIHDVSTWSVITRGP